MFDRDEELQELSRYFEPQIRQRGEDYYRRGTVRLAEASDSRVLATVEGTRRYTVELRFRGGEILMGCSCPYHLDSGNPCKHLWALILTLGARARRREGSPSSQAERRPQDRESSGGRPGRGGTPGGAARRQPAQARRPAWRETLDEIRLAAGAALSEPAGAGGAEAGRSELFYALDAEWSRSEGQTVVQLFHRRKGSNEPPALVSEAGIRAGEVSVDYETHEEDILAFLSELSARGEYGYDYPRRPRGERELLEPVVFLSRGVAEVLLPKMCATGRCLLLAPENERRGIDAPASPHGFTLSALSLDQGRPWELSLAVEPVPSARRWRLTGFFRRDDERLPVEQADLILEGGLLVARDRLHRYAAEQRTRTWLLGLARSRRIEVSKGELTELLEGVLAVPDLPPLEIDESADLRIVRTGPVPRLELRSASAAGYSNAGGKIAGELSFDYDGIVTGDGDPPGGVLRAQEKLVVVRDRGEEQRARARLRELGFREMHEYSVRRRVLKLGESRVAEVIRTLLDEQWVVEAEDRLRRRAGRVDIHFTSGIDWFEAHGEAVFDGQRVPLPELLKAVRRGRTMIRLGDGSFGLLPEEWLRHQGLALTLGEASGDGVRFKMSQALLIDLLFHEHEPAARDTALDSLRAKIVDFDGIEAGEAPKGFTGTLRGYQKEGLGWFRFLDSFAFGGCLADDMGLGKTVQVLALLEARRSAVDGPSKSERRRSLLDGKPIGPEEGEEGNRTVSLVVVPKSLVFNWVSEAARFTPRLSVLVHAGADRHAKIELIEHHDVVITTYGTLRNDIERLRTISFDYVVLDEAQAIKNAQSATAKAARLLDARRRLALSGTPIENHLGELWSIFEFLNPGMLGSVALFSRHFASREGYNPAAGALLARALRPFILRRTKQQVAPELPSKIEQTLYCELSPAERRRYEELAGYYRKHLREKIEAEGFARSKFQVLEALLRLRQAACHPALLDPSAHRRSSAKVEMLLEQLEDVLAEGKKALVFSQFTSFLAIVRGHLDRHGVVYEYLDGQTTDREERVRRFQSDPECSLFVISLKAGGLGLNLTAAEYVFVLDPWWNPAVEAQAVDRTHRIGQQRAVFAYRLIAKDTVEEKVLALQDSKRSLAEAIINEDNRLIGKLEREDLELLLS